VSRAPKIIFSPERFEGLHGFLGLGTRLGCSSPGGGQLSVQRGLDLRHRLLGLDCGYSMGRSRFCLSLGGLQFGLGISQLAGEIIELCANLVGPGLGGGQARRQLGDVIRLTHRLIGWLTSAITADLLDLPDDVKPIDLVGHVLAGSEPPEQCALLLRPKQNVVSIEIAVAAHGMPLASRRSRTQGKRLAGVGLVFQ
jgi:hypothetical protein